MTEVELIEKDLSYLIMQAAFEVHNTLGPGYPENIYDEGMALELSARGVENERQKKVTVQYKGAALGEFVLDNVANQRIVLEYLAVREITPIHKQQVLSYLKATGLQLAIIINFGAEFVQSSRVVNTKAGRADIFRIPNPKNPARDTGSLEPTP